MMVFLRGLLGLAIGVALLRPLHWLRARRRETPVDRARKGGGW